MSDTVKKIIIIIMASLSAFVLCGGLIAYITYCFRNSLHIVDKDASSLEQYELQQKYLCDKYSKDFSVVYSEATDSYQYKSDDCDLYVTVLSEGGKYVDDYNEQLLVSANLAEINRIVLNEHRTIKDHNYESRYIVLYKEKLNTSLFVGSMFDDDITIDFYLVDDIYTSEVERDNLTYKINCVDGVLHLNSMR